MKKSHIILIVIIAVLIGGILTTFGDASTYAHFELAQANQGKEYIVIGKLKKDDDISFNPKTTMLRFTAIDDSGAVSTVYFNEPKPTDFERSESITMTGYATDTAFIASDILMKCPSKYNEQNRMDGNTDSYSEEI